MSEPLAAVESGRNRLMRGFLRRAALIALTAALSATRALGAEWSTTELHHQYGDLVAPSFAGGSSAATHVLTFQHASGWAYGDNYFFVDIIDDDVADGFDDGDLYAELYANFSLGRLLRRPVKFGRIRDVGLLAGVNWSADADVTKYLPGIRLSWDLPGFAFLNLDLMAYLDASAGLAHGGAPAESDSYMVDVNWERPFTFGTQRFSLEGHAEFAGRLRDELGGRVHSWVLAQPQFRYDLGNALFERPAVLFVGVEWQLWINKLGDAATDENVLQTLLVWRL